MFIVVMGVCACGKSSVGEALAAAMGWNYLEGDELHPQSNREKMASGIALTDEDRWPWLDRIVERINQWEASGQHAVIACSALRRSYRELLLSADADLLFLYLTIDQQTVKQRLRSREDHFFPASLVKSQFETLEVPNQLEALHADATQPINDIVNIAINVWDLQMYQE